MEHLSGGGGQKAANNKFTLGTRCVFAVGRIEFIIPLGNFEISASSVTNLAAGRSKAERQAGRVTGLATFAAEDRVGHRVTHMMLVYFSSLRNTRRLDYTRFRGDYAVSSFLIAPRSPPRPLEKSNRLREGDNIPIDRGTQFSMVPGLLSWDTPLRDEDS